MKKEIEDKIQNILSNVDGIYYDLNDIFMNLIGEEKDYNTELDNFLSHNQTKYLMEYMQSYFFDYEPIVYGKKVVLGTRFIVCCALLYIDSDTYYPILMDSDSNLVEDLKWYHQYSGHSITY